MRRVLLIGIVSLFAVSGALGQLPANPLEGTWEMISQQAVYPDSTVDRTDQIPYTIKILNSTHFAFGRQILDEEVFAGGAPTRSMGTRTPSTLPGTVLRGWRDSPSSLKPASKVIRGTTWATFSISGSKRSGIGSVRQGKETRKRWIEGAGYKGTGIPFYLPKLFGVNAPGRKCCRAIPGSRDRP